VNDSEIILIIDGIDYLKDKQTKKDAITSFWFPTPVPKRVRFILTSYGKNDAMDYFAKFNCQMISLEESGANIDRIIHHYSEERYGVFYAGMREVCYGNLGNYMSRRIS
jgi:hypothetical protein